MPNLLAITAAMLSGQATIRVTPLDLTSAREPQITIASDSRVYVAFGVGDSVFVSTSMDQGRSYGAPVLVGAPSKLSLGMRRGPRITEHNGVITVTAIYGAQGKGRDGDLVAFRSGDKGRTWSASVRVNSVEGSAREGLHAMAQGPDGTLACAWLDLRRKGTTLYVASSKDGGLTWGENLLAYDSPSGTICECCHPSLAFDRTGTLHVLFRNLIEGDRDMYLLKSADMHKFSQATKLGKGSWRLQACPMDGGMISITAKGDVETIWRRENTVYTSRGQDQETPIAEGRNPWVASLRSGSLLVWQDGKSVMATWPGRSPHTLAGEGSSPVSASSPDGRFAIIAWTNRGVESIRVVP
jgi:hypothetical protein